MFNNKAIIAYDGTHYLGWQKTKMGPSIEEMLERALKQVLQEEIVLQAASRTDRGVHAMGQVVNFFTNKSVNLEKLKISLQGVLPKDIVLLNLEEATSTFHPTLDCVEKEYHYTICNTPFQLPFHRNFSWHFRYPLDLAMMRQAAELIVGERDFSAFSNERLEDSVRKVTEIKIEELSEGRILICVIGKSFLYKMVRNIAGTLVYIGCGKIALEELPRILESRDRRLSGMTAPAHGLCLKRVSY